MVLGGLLGWQRERWAKPAGIRTYALVTAGSTLFTILSLHAFGPNEVGRLAAQVVIGIGFIGAGTILHRSDHIEGLTTAAGLWISAAIGMAVGVGWYVLAVLCTLLILAMLIVDEKKLLISTPPSTSAPTKPTKKIARATK